MVFLDVAYDTHCHRHIGETHLCEFQLQCIVRIFSVVYKDIALFDTVFSYFHYFQIESVEHKSFVFVGTENHRFAVFEEYGVFGSCLFRRYGRMSTIIEYHTVYQTFHYRSTFVAVSGREHHTCSLEVDIEHTCKERSARTHSDCRRLESLFDSTERRRLGDEALRRRRRILSFGKTVNPVVEQQYIDVDITSDAVYKVVATDSEAVAVARRLPNAQTRIGSLDA